ncbi:plasmid mobilization protein [Clostridium perfringens]|uniref:plasmid mobilization protein n=1 Tax=Clostridium perfringens TaxID=1502 RepID=UPI003C6C40DE
MRDKQIKFYATENEKEQIKNNVAISKLNQNEYLLKCALEKEILVIEGLDEILNQLARVGNNLNQLTRLGNEGQIINSSEVRELKKEFENIWQQLKQLKRKPVVNQD